MRKRSLMVERWSPDNSKTQGSRGLTEFLVVYLEFRFASLQVYAAVRSADCVR